MITEENVEVPRLLKMRAYEGIPDVLCPGSSCHPTEETHCCCLYPRLPKSGPTVYNHRWSLKDRWTGKSTSLDNMMIWHKACSTDNAAPNHPSFASFIFPSLVYKTTRYLNSFTWGRSSLPNQRDQSTFFPQRTMATNMEVLPIIPTALHTAVNHSSDGSDVFSLGCT